MYPVQVTGIGEGANLIRKALREEANVQCIHVRVPGLQFINTSEACRSYQAVLERVIDQARQNHPSYTIDLALSGEQEGTIATTIFAAQKKHLPYVYHMLITDEELSKDINRQTTVQQLADLSKEDRNNRLFLRAYEEEGMYKRLVFFKVPVLST